MSPSTSRGYAGSGRGNRGSASGHARRRGRDAEWSHQKRERRGVRGSGTSARPHGRLARGSQGGSGDLARGSGGGGSARAIGGSGGGGGRGGGSGGARGRGALARARA